MDPVSRHSQLCARQAGWRMVYSRACMEQGVSAGRVDVLQVS